MAARKATAKGARAAQPAKPAPKLFDIDAPVDAHTPINLALQGGGAHGAFTWGVLDWILERGPLKIDGISGTSAGAMNAVALVSGYHKGGPDGARRALEDYWRAVSRSSRMSPVQRTVVDRMMGNWSLDWSPGFMMVDLISRFVSPYEFNPLNLNPLKDLLEEIVDFDAVRACDSVRLFLSATNVRTGKVKLFHNREITADHVMASACIPLMFQAVEIDGVPYWDGGYSGNPALWPFFYETEARDLLLIQINPIERPETPKSAREILNRMNEITFNSSLLKELRAIEFVDRLVEQGVLPADRYRQIRVHVIDGGESLNGLTASSKFNAEWKFLTFLRDRGRAAAERFVEQFHQNRGEQSTADMRRIFE
ncbi:patatin-like phospholipase family protein [Microbaculum marinisediminis]|uniref:Patatin-like phospholipase family protein n=1 Tax=Microbaculum marinisediminis TaxID=2931392 RepID=A0AAW5QWJ1_9HYPH|nr:patatin-like phospholipase family protein [Microbaculum sp. A6E488]MCT8972431.1 patatin-like phospholipase family protein [Microbaculum sp. A6E488]